MINLSAYVETLEGKPVAVYGLGLSGMATVRALLEAGAGVLAWDDDEIKRSEAAALGARIDPLQKLNGTAALVLSPGIPLYYPAPHPVVKAAKAANVEVLGDVEIFYRNRPSGKTIGITGTNGKSTTTALLGHILREGEKNVEIGGNIGRAVFEMDEADLYVLELSSYQLDLCPGYAPEIAVHLNLTPDHLDRHGDLAGYIAAKMRIFRGTGDAVIGSDDDPSRGMLTEVRKAGQRRVFEISATHPVGRGVYVDNGLLFDAMDGRAGEVADLGFVIKNALPGRHNHQNIAAAYAAARLLGLEPAAIIDAVKTYPGLPHRLFTVATINGIPYIDDSKATNADAASRALACYEDIYWILGGRPKAGGLSGVEDWLSHVRHAYTIGEAADDFSAWLKTKAIAASRCGTLEQALTEAHQDAQAAGRGVVLLSPACASFDQFRSFEHRGQVFTDLVGRL